MAQRIVETLVDDITGKEIPEGEGENIRFAVNGVEYSIDLDKKNAAKFHTTMDFYVTHAQRIGRSGNVTTMRRSSKNTDIDTAAVRAWAESNGIDISSRGRIRADVVEQFKAAMA